MKDELITFETAKLAKEKGFNITTSLSLGVGLYDEDGKLYSSCLINGSEIFVATQSLLQRWLREKEQSVTLNRQDKFRPEHKAPYYYFIHQIGNRYCSLPLQFDTYELALEAGLVKALNYL